MTTILTAGPLDDLDFLRQVHRVIADQLMRQQIPELQALADETWRRLREAAVARERLVLQYTGPALHNFVVGPAFAPLPVSLRPAGGHAVKLALLNPGRQVSLGRRLTRRAWHAAICRTVETVAQVQPLVADRLRFATAHEAPGLRLWEREGQVLLRWRPAPNRDVLGA